MIFAIVLLALFFFFFFFNDTATTEIYTLSLHDALPISHLHSPAGGSLCRATITRISSGCSFLGQPGWRSEEHTSELQSRSDLVCRLLLEKKKKRHYNASTTAYTYMTAVTVERCSVLTYI